MITKINLELTENQLNTLLSVLEQDLFMIGQNIEDNQVTDMAQIYDKLINLRNVFKRNKDIENI